MKRFCIFFELILIINICFGQADTLKQKKNFILGVNFGTLVSPSSEGINYFAYLTIKNGRSLLAIGPVLGPKLILKNSNGGDLADGQHRINGFHISYQINPNEENKIFDLFFHYQFIFLEYKDRGSYSDPWVSYDYHAYRMDIENMIGYGFKAKFSRNLYLTQSFGFGLRYSDFKCVRSWNSDFVVKEFSPAFMVNLSIGYKFERKKRKQ